MDSDREPIKSASWNTRWGIAAEAEGRTRLHEAAFVLDLCDQRLILDEWGLNGLEAARGTSRREI